MGKGPLAGTVRPQSFALAAPKQGCVSSNQGQRLRRGRSSRTLLTFDTGSVLSEPSDAEILQFLAERIDKRESGVGIVVGAVDPGGRRAVGRGRLGAGNPRQPGGAVLLRTARNRRASPATSSRKLL